jgi:hypothetical protein
MTRLDSTAPFADLNTALTRLLAEFGTMRTLTALLRALIAARRPPPAKRLRRHPLNCNHLRRDIGLPPVREPLPSQRGHWPG